MENVKTDKFRQFEILRSENVVRIRQAMMDCEALKYKGLKVVKKCKSGQLIPN